MRPPLGKRKSNEMKGIFLKTWLDFDDLKVLTGHAFRDLEGHLDLLCRSAAGC